MGQPRRLLNLATSLQVKVVGAAEQVVRVAGQPGMPSNAYAPPGRHLLMAAEGAAGLQTAVDES